MSKPRNIKVSSKIKSQRMRNIFSQSYDSNYAKNKNDAQINKDIQYLRNTLYRSKKAFEKKGLGEETGKYFDSVLKNIRVNKNMSKQEKTELLNAAVSYARRHRLTVSLFEAQKELTMESLTSDKFSSVVRQSREMDNKKNITAKDLTNKELYQVFEVLEQIRRGLGKYEKAADNGSADEFDAAVEVIYSMSHESNDWEFDRSLSIGENVLAYLRKANKKVSGKVFG